MLFTDLSFWAFFAVVVVLYALLPHRAQNRMLLVASYVFYGAWDWRFLSLILASTLTDYLVSLKLEEETVEKRRKVLLSVSLGANLGILAVFKYLGFFADSLQSLVSGLGYQLDPVTLSIVLPVGISFYTFQSLGYSIDVYRRDVRPERNFLDFALFVAFFPQLVAGPIERAKNLLPNIQTPRTVSFDAIRRGVVLCLLGLIKKVVIADGIAPFVDSVFASSGPTQVEVVLAVWLFAIQIYCDFSAYSDIARGISKMLGFNLMRNFAQPYFATNPQEFWRRWHISLSTWLRDYLYISIGGNRNGSAKTARNLMATMMLGGLWHGAAWNFVAWGTYQGGLLILHKRIGLGTRSPSVILSVLVRLIKIAFFFQVICFGWLLFRAESFDQIVDLTGRLTGFIETANGITVQMPAFAAMLGIVLLFCWDALTEMTGDDHFYRRLAMPFRAMLYASMVYFLAFGSSTQSAAFIYFAF